MADYENGTKIKEDILLINPPPFIRRDPHDHTDYPHIGLAYIGAYLRQSDFACRAIDAKFENINMEGLTQLLRQRHPGIIGITAFTHEVFSGSFDCFRRSACHCSARSNSKAVSGI